MPRIPAFSPASCAPVAVSLILGGCVPELVTSGPKVITGDFVAPPNSWPVSEILPPNEVECGGFDVGDTVCEFRLKDQFGDEVSLWQFWGDVIVLDISTIWCIPCQKLAASTQATYDHFKDDGVMYLTVLQEDANSNPPDTQDLNDWGDAFGIQAPILADGHENQGSRATGAAVTGGQFPGVLLIDRNMKVQRRVVPPDAETLDGAIEDLIAR